MAPVGTRNRCGRPEAVRPSPMKKVWASAGESDAKSRFLVKSRLGGGGPAGSASVRKTPTRYPLPSAEEIPEIESTAGIDVGSGGYDGLFASGETVHDHVVPPSGPGGGANAPGGPPTQRWNGPSSSSLRANCTVPGSVLVIGRTESPRRTAGRRSRNGTPLCASVRECPLTSGTSPAGVRTSARISRLARPEAAQPGRDHQGARLGSE